jgi:hypothetical protein
MAEIDKQLLLIHPAWETKQLLLTTIHNKKSLEFILVDILVNNFPMFEACTI